MPGSTMLDYAVEPATIDYSAGPDRRSVVTLTITATNTTATPVTCSLLSITVPVGFGADALTEDPTTIAASAGASTPWAIGGGGGQWIAVPLPPAVTVAPGERVSHTLAAIAVNSTAGPARIAIGETTDRTRATTVTVKKTAPAPPGSTPRIDAFTADPDRIAQDGRSTLAWTVSNAEHLVLAPGPVHLPDPGDGTLPINPERTTTFTLTALGAGGTADAIVTVTVMPVAIEVFTTDAPASVAPGTPVTVRWDTRFATAVSINQGIGPVDAAGTFVVTPQQTTVYALTASGLDPQTRTITVAVN